MGRQKCIIYFSNTNYTKETGGTEKFLENIISLMSIKGIGSVQIYPLKRVNRWIKKIYKDKVEQYVCLNINGQYYGVISTKKLYNLLMYIGKKEKLEYQGVIINQMNYFDKDVLKDTLCLLNIPVKLIVHDFTYVCPYSFWNNKTGIACENKIVEPNKKNCHNCNYQMVAEYNYKQSIKFFGEIENILDTIIFPSDNTKTNWEEVFKLDCQYVVRPHLTYRISPLNRYINKKIKIAFLGQISNHKGIQEWNFLRRKLSLDKFEFYYFGNSTKFEDDPCIKCFDVDYKKKDNIPMKEQLERNEIDVVFLWSKCQETYSYTYFESCEAGCYVISNVSSGNIAEMIQRNHNGKTFNTIEDCLKWFSDERALIDIEEYFTNGMRICDVHQNKDISALEFRNTLIKHNIEIKAQKVYRTPFLTLIARNRYFQY